MTTSDHAVALREHENEFTTTHHVYEPHRAGVPPLRPYITELWRRREFAAEMSRATLRSANTMTVFGQLWLVLNPLLLAAVYYLLVQVLSGSHQGMAYFARLTAGLFTFYYVAGAMQSGAASVVTSGKLLLNTAFPRLLMPFSAVRTAFYRFLPTVPVFFFFLFLAGKGLTLASLAAIPFLFLLTVFSMGLASFFAALQVYFRDTTSFLPYFTRIWLYTSPVLWTLDSIPHGFRKIAVLLEVFNPLFAMLGGFTQSLVDGVVPRPTVWLIAAAWAFGTLVVGSLYFMSRERDFAVRL